MSGGGMVLHGHVVDDDARDQTIADLRDEVRDLRQSLAESRAAATRAQRDIQHAVSALRNQLTPLYKALQVVFGELDTVGVGGESAQSPQQPRVSAVWESWKQRMPGAPAKAIDALLLHQSMNHAQLCIATGIPKGSMTNVISRLNKAGLISKNGGYISLKQI